MGTKDTKINYQFDFWVNADTLIDDREPDKHDFDEVEVEDEDGELFDAYDFRDVKVCVEFWESGTEDGSQFAEYAIPAKEFVSCNLKDEIKALKKEALKLFKQELKKQGYLFKNAEEW